jgi:hypothetical protein
MGAVCKLVRSLEYCANGHRNGDMIDLLIDEAAKEVDGSEAHKTAFAAIEEHQRQAEKVEWYCSALQVPISGERMRRLHQAAEFGDVGAMVRFSLNPPLDRVTIENANEAGLFRDEAPRMLERAVLLGDLNAVRAMFMAQRVGILDTDYGSIPVPRNTEMLIATANVLREFADQQTRSDVEEYLAVMPPQEIPPFSSTKALRLQKRIREALVRSPSGYFSRDSSMSAVSPPACG